MPNRNGYSYTGSGTNSQGNHYCSRDYGSGSNSNGAGRGDAYHYSNRYTVSRSRCSLPVLVRSS
ncbi:hypothetical protein BDW42DRAFT_177617 [Aspergillus taichungensis]|uniref:Uncharacterized protein n=1 Tax=Aspergillus taichungensis TaxID=482145 RepID=A0A2J5HIU4_9EURO|nr:hypothetical protein BDW42DRAFT_177617 [Aspergillus taichungensis]